MEFMTLAEVRENATEIWASFENLMNNPVVAPRKNAAQWQYFRHCLAQTLGAPTKVHEWRPLQIAQYKFEVEYKLRRLYLRSSQPLAFIFRLVSRRDALRENLVVDDDYPDVSGYHLLVRDRRDSPGDDPKTTASNRDYIEMVVAACIDAKFEAYQALPTIDEVKLLQWFAKDGPAYKEMIYTLKKVAQRSWTLTNSHNPSTKRLMSMNVREIREGRALVKTTEYWHLRWWSNIEWKYRSPSYRETSRNTYFLIQAGDEWLVEEHILPPPLSSTPHRP